MFHFAERGTEARSAKRADHPAAMPGSRGGWTPGQGSHSWAWKGHQGRGLSLNLIRGLPWAAGLLLATGQ